VSKRWVGPLLILGMVVFTVVVYGHLPSRIPVHWNAAGKVNGWAKKWPWAFLTPVVAAGIWLLLSGLRRVDPRRAHYERFNETFWLFLNLVTAMMALVEVFSLGYALGWGVNMSMAMMAAMSVMFIAVGNYLPRIRSNWWMGIRTPWTLESERVWRETHRMGGRTFVAGGIVALLSLVLPAPLRLWVFVSVMALAGLAPVVYSYVVWRRGDAH
jgi:immunity protein, SdpI family